MNPHEISLEDGRKKPIPVGGIPTDVGEKSQIKRVGADGMMGLELVANNNEGIEGDEQRDHAKALFAIQRVQLGLQLSHPGAKGR